MLTFCLKQKIYNKPEIACFKVDIEDNGIEVDILQTGRQLAEFLNILKVISTRSNAFWKILGLVLNEEIIIEKGNFNLNYSSLIDENFTVNENNYICLNKKFIESLTYKQTRSVQVNTTPFYEQIDFVNPEELIKS